MRNKRLDIIKDIISHEIIETQDELLDALEGRNIRVTQATISRDIKELMLIKVPTGSGHYRYAMPFEGRSSYIFTKESMAPSTSDLRRDEISEILSISFSYSSLSSITRPIISTMVVCASKLMSG